MKNNRICQILGIEKPVIQGPLSWLTDARLVAAVSNAGGLGVLGPNAGLTADTAVSNEITLESWARRPFTDHVKEMSARAWAYWL